MSGGVAETGRDCCLCSSCQSVLVRRAPAALKLLLGGARRHLVAVGAELLGREEPEVVGGVVVAALQREGTEEVRWQRWQWQWRRRR